MNSDEFLSAVQDTTHIKTREETERAVTATLSVLGERLSTEAAQLAAQLPPTLRDALLSHNDATERFDLDEFYRRVAEREGVTPEKARAHARAVTAALRESAGAEYVQALSQLPQDFGELVHSNKGEYPRSTQVPRE